MVSTDLFIADKCIYSDALLNRSSTRKNLPLVTKSNQNS